MNGTYADDVTLISNNIAAIERKEDIFIKCQEETKYFIVIWM